METKREIMTLFNQFDVIDLTHLVTNGMPVFPGSDEVILGKSANVTENGYNEIRFSFSGHTGTHIDCGKHMFDNGFDTASTPVGCFAGRGIVINLPEASTVIDEALLQQHEKRISKGGFILFHTGWDRFWTDERYFRGFPVLTQSAVQFLIRFHPKGIGLDAPSFDPVDSADLPVHHALLAADIILIENLTNLSALSGHDFLFCCFPLKIENGDGSPVRAVAMLPDDINS